MISLEARRTPTNPPIRLSLITYPDLLDFAEHGCSIMFVLLSRIVFRIVGQQTNKKQATPSRLYADGGSPRCRHGIGLDPSSKTISLIYGLRTNLQQLAMS